MILGRLVPCAQSPERRTLRWPRRVQHSESPPYSPRHLEYAKRLRNFPHRSGGLGLILPVKADATSPPHKLVLSGSNETTLAAVPFNRDTLVDRL